MRIGIDLGGTNAMICRVTPPNKPSHLLLSVNQILGELKNRVSVGFYPVFADGWVRAKNF